ncbi:MAG: hypothetical protein AB1480_06975 [Nitrospirota bacterium]
MRERKQGKNTKKKEFRFATSFTMRFDSLTYEMLEKIAYNEDITKPEAVRSAVKLLFLKKYGQEELEKLREKKRVNR